MIAILSLRGNKWALESTNQAQVNLPLSSFSQEKPAWRRRHMLFISFLSVQNLFLRISHSIFAICVIFFPIPQLHSALSSSFPTNFMFFVLNNNGKKNATRNHRVKFGFVIYSWAWDLDWSVSNLPWVTPLNKTDFPHARSYDLRISFQPGVRLHAYFPSSMLGCLIRLSLF